MKIILICVNLLVAALPGFVVTRGCGTQQYALPSNDTTNYVAPTFDTVAKKYLALGDSYTIGQNVKMQDRYPAQTRDWLERAGVKLQQPDYIATTGWATVNLVSAMHYARIPHNYDVVTLLIGVNDQYQGRDTGLYRAKFTEALHSAVSIAGGRPWRVVVLSIPDYSVTPFVKRAKKPTVRAGVNRFNAINKQVAIQNSVTYLDITPASRKAKNNPLLIAYDDMHPSGLEYRVWAGMLGPVIKKMFRQ